MEVMKKQFVLVHGACHGSWCWYKLKPLLEAAGHKVTAVDMAASGIDLRKIEELRTLDDYTVPLTEFMESLPQEEKVILMGHSYGGMNLGLAMEKYPQKIYAAVFLTALMPDSVHMSSYVLDQDVALASSLIRPSSLFIEDLSKAKYFTDEGYGSVKKVYIICTEDKVLPKEFQQRLIDNIGTVTEAKEIKGADHMAMLCMPKQLCDTLLEIAYKYN
uniref:Salicylic acid-binding protein 2 n=1 Tax=Solanum tuberosum TaxID=4113 RepID=M1CEZ6_SOLTU